MKTKLRANTPLPVLGLNTAAPGEWIDKRYLTNAQNMEIRRSELMQRPGSDQLGDGMGERVMKFAELVQGAERSVLRFGLTKIEKLNAVDNSWSDVAHAALTGTAADKFSVAYPNLSGAKILVYSNGIDAPGKWTGAGSTAALGGSPPKFKFGVAYKAYFVVAYITNDGSGNTYRQRVQWPDTDNPEGWATGLAGSTNLLEDGEDISGLAVFGDFLAVHKEGSIYLGYLVDTDEVFRFERKPTGAGAISNDTIFNLPNGNQVFLARDGIHLFNGVTAPLIDSPIMEEIREGMNPEFAYRATAQLVANRDEYHVAIPMGSQEEPETVYKYNYRTGRVMKDVRPGLTAMGLYQRSDSETWDEDSESWDSDVQRWDDTTLLELAKVLMMGFDDGVVTRMSSALNDAGEAIDAFFETKDFTAQDLGSGLLGQVVEWLEVRMWAKGDAVTVSYSADAGATWTAVETVTLTAEYPAGLERALSYLHAATGMIRFRFRNNAVSETFSMKAFVPAGVPMEEGV